MAPSRHQGRSDRFERGLVLLSADPITRKRWVNVWLADEKKLYLVRFSTSKLGTQPIFKPSLNDRIISADNQTAARTASFVIKRRLLSNGINQRLLIFIWLRIIQKAVKNNAQITTSPDGIILTWSNSTCTIHHPRRSPPLVGLVRKPRLGR